MKLRFSYSFVIATDSFKESLIKVIRVLADIPSLNIVIIINGNKSTEIRAQYEAIITLTRVTFISTPIKGKSNALNIYIRTIKDESAFIIFTDDDILMNKENIGRYIETVEQNGRGYFYGGGVDVERSIEVKKDLLSLYPPSIRGIKETDLPKKKIFLGCNWGAFASDIQAANYFNPYFGPGSITGSVGQESQMMIKLLKAGIKPLPVFDCRVTHFAPENYHEAQWLYRRRFREGIQRGLLYKRSFIQTFARRTAGIFNKSPLIRMTNLHFLLGMLYSFKFLFKKIE